MKTLAAYSVFSVLIVYVSCLNVFRDSGLYEGSKCTTSEAKPGICRVNCSTLPLVQLKDVNNLCGFDKCEVIVCCPKASYPVLTEACVYRSRKQTLRNEYFGLIEKMAQDEVQARDGLSKDLKYDLNSKAQDNFDDCIKESDSIGGTEGENYKGWCRSLHSQFQRYIGESNVEFPKYKYPHMVLLGWRNTNHSVSWNCAGTLVHKSFVLTTAHCALKYGKPPNLARISEQRLIRRGRDKFTIEYDVEKVIAHDSFDSSTLYNDIALLKIKLKSGLGDKAPPLPICIWTRNDYPTINFKTLGYGSPSFGLSPVLSLRDNNSTLVPNSDCSKSYNSNTMLPDGLRGSQLCSSDPKRVTGGCKDDSGGPLQFTDTDEFETPYLVGITSFGLRCRGSNPGIYTRIYDFLEWIEAKMSENLL